MESGANSYIRDLLGLQPSPASQEPAGCFEVESETGEGTIYQVMFEPAPRSDTGRRVFERTTLAQVRHKGRAVRPVVFYLTEGSEGCEPQDRYEVEADGRRVLEFRFDTVRLWEFGAQDLLARPAPALWALVALSGGATEQDVEQAYRQLAEQVHDRRERSDLLCALCLVSGTRFDPAWLRRLIPREEIMESATYKEILEEGLERGLERGRLETLRRSVLLVAEKKLGAVAEDASRRLEAMRNADELEALLCDLASAADAAAAAAVLARATRRARARTRTRTPTQPRTRTHARSRTQPRAGTHTRSRTRSPGPRRESRPTKPRRPAK